MVVATVAAAEAAAVAAAVAAVVAAAPAAASVSEENFFWTLNIYFLCFLPAKPVFIQALERQFFRGFGDFRRLGVRRYMAQTRPSERIRMHPIASERIRAGPNRSKHVPELPKTSENSRKLQKICENF